MQIIEEMRQAVSLQNLRNGHVELPPSMPDWAVKRLFQKRNGLPLSALPAGIRTLKAGEVSFIAGPAKRNAELKIAADAVARGIAADQELAEMQRIRQRISLLS